MEDTIEITFFNINYVSKKIYNYDKRLTTFDVL